MEPVKGEVSAPCGVTGQGSVFAINHNADNALITPALPAEGRGYPDRRRAVRGERQQVRAWLVRRSAKCRRADLDDAAQELGLQGVRARGGALGARPTPAAPPASPSCTAGRNTQTEGWWRQAFDIYRIPYDYIDPQAIRDTREPARRSTTSSCSAPAAVRRWCRGCRCGATRFRIATRPRRPTSAPGRRPTTPASGWDSQGLAHLQEFIDAGGVFLGVEQQRRVRDHQLHLRRQRQPAGRQLAGGRIAAADPAGRRRRARWPTAFPTTSRCTATAATASPSAPTSAARARGRRRRRAAARRAAGAAAARAGRPAAARLTIPTSCRAGRRSRAPTFRRCRRRRQVQPWQYALPTEEQLRRNPATLIPPQFRPRVAVRFDAQSSLLVSGLLDGGADIAQRAVVVDVPVGKGHVVLFANNPIWRGSDDRQLFPGVQRDAEPRQPGRREKPRPSMNSGGRSRREFLTQATAFAILPQAISSARELSADVVIIGGGFGGVAAALAAARNGQRVILTEETDWIGGQVTSQARAARRASMDRVLRLHAQLIATIATACGTTTAVTIRSTEARARAAASQSRQRDGQPHRATSRASRSRCSRRCWRRMCRAGACTSCCGTQPIAADVDRDVVRSVTVRSLETGARARAPRAVFPRRDGARRSAAADADRVRHRLRVAARRPASRMRRTRRSRSTCRRSRSASRWTIVGRREMHTIERPAEYEFWRRLRAAD